MQGWRPRADGAADSCSRYWQRLRPGAGWELAQVRQEPAGGLLAALGSALRRLCGGGEGAAAGGSPRGLLCGRRRWALRPAAQRRGRHCCRDDGNREPHARRLRRLRRRSRLCLRLRLLGRCDRTLSGLQLRGCFGRLNRQGAGLRHSLHSRRHARLGGR